MRSVTRLMRFILYHMHLAARNALLACLLTLSSALGMTLVPMDDTQTDHLRAYGLVFRVLRDGAKAYWLLNYRGGSFAVDESQKFTLEARVKGVTIQTVSATDWARILETIQNSNMEKVTLEKSPRIAVYTPPEKLPWDDAVTLALTYAEIPYDKVYDKEVITGKLGDYDWLHLHHEDFTGQYSKFYRSFGSSAWYQRDKAAQEKISREMGFAKVSQCKKAVALAIRQYVEKGGFLFAMCCATNTLEDALAAAGTDIVDKVYDGDGIDPDWRQKLNYANCMAFENFTIETDALAGNHDNIDVNLVNTPLQIPAQDFELFDFSAKLDPVPCMLVQDHTRVVKGFHGLLTSFNRDIIRKSVIVLGQVPGTRMVTYIHGVVGKGQFAYYGGHDPEDYSHAVGDQPTMLELHRNSPGYRLILNNVLFPAAEKKEKKT
jgi:hypothetical protein